MKCFNCKGENLEIIKVKKKNRLYYCLDCKCATYHIWLGKKTTMVRQYLEVSSHLIMHDGKKRER